MLISKQACSEKRRRQGSARADFAELRCQLEKPSDLDKSHRQRLLKLAEKLARVRALGGEYGRVDLSEHAQSALYATTA